MRLKNNIDYKRFPEPCRGDCGRFTILVLSALKRVTNKRLLVTFFLHLQTLPEPTLTTVT